jgi:hypothetical protein
MRRNFGANQDRGSHAFRVKPQFCNDTGDASRVINHPFAGCMQAVFVLLQRLGTGAPYKRLP